MKVVIIEDEQPAADKLIQLLQQRDPNTEVLAVLRRLDEAIAWFKKQPDAADLIFADVHLPDGLSFQLFNQLNLKQPVIFITAYDTYALDAFRVNGIDYLLKPLRFADLDRSLQKMGQWKGQNDEIRQMGENWGKKAYKNRFMVKLGEHLRAVNADQILLFYAEGRTVFLYTLEGRKFIVDFTLDQLEELLDPALFFRINRSNILQLNAIKEVVIYSTSRLRVVTQPEFTEELIVSREKVGAFKGWFG